MSDGSAQLLGAGVSGRLDDWGRRWNGFKAMCGCKRTLRCCRLCAQGEDQSGGLSDERHDASHSQTLNTAPAFCPDSLQIPRSQSEWGALWDPQGESTVHISTSEDRIITDKALDHICHVTVNSVASLLDQFLCAGDKMYLSKQTWLRIGWHQVNWATFFQLQNSQINWLFYRTFLPTIRLFFFADFVCTKWKG